ncbi:MAG TPA: flagellar basal body L-ring protein FlgH [Caulobacteraceae bacterium]|nr:flagellar basal body L-ring protein FlgH [Caulobacteraceae bacterium]
MRPAAFALALLALPGLAGCGSIHEAISGPRLGPMAYPAPLVAENQPVLESAREPLPQPAGADSLWRTGAREFFADQRADRVGDIVTVLISIADSAKTSNTTTTSKTSANNFGVPHFLGLESTLGKVLPKAYDPSSLISTNGSATTAGDGAIARSEQINLTIAAVVTQVLPNGNLVIQGSQEVRTDYELRQLTVAGIVRPEDISAANTINQTQIAEARISYGGRGDVSAVQKTPVGTSLLQRFFPF